VRFAVWRVVVSTPIPVERIQFARDRVEQDLHAKVRILQGTGATSGETSSTHGHSARKGAPASSLA